VLQKMCFVFEFSLRLNLRPYGGIDMYTLLRRNSVDFSRCSTPLPDW